MTDLQQYYGQYLIVCQQNYTLTHLAEHSDWVSHDRINRYLALGEVGPTDVWEHVKGDVIWHPMGYLLFDDTVLDKSYSRKIEGVRRQYSGNAHGLVRGIGLVQCVYFNPELNRFWVIDYRLFDPDFDGKDKLDHVWDMLTACEAREVAFQYVLMDTWYATAQMMRRLDAAQKTFFCPIKSNRKVSDAPFEAEIAVIQGRKQKGRTYQAVKDLSWTDEEDHTGKAIKIKDLPVDMQITLHRVGASTSSTIAEASAYTYLVTNDHRELDTVAVEQEAGYRWKIEQVHREEKQLTGIERCQCRRRNCQRTHIATAIMVWNSLKIQVQELGKTVYQLKKDLLSQYLKAQLANPSIVFA